MLIVVHRVYLLRCWFWTNDVRWHRPGYLLVLVHLRFNLSINPIELVVNLHHFVAVLYLARSYYSWFGQIIDKLLEMISSLHVHQFVFSSSVKELRLQIIDQGLRFASELMLTYVSLQIFVTWHIYKVQGFGFRRFFPRDFRVGSYRNFKFRFTFKSIFA